ncbi:MAG: hypothetical protein RI984_1987 [Pseudomonadota bacterium]|jgi:hypothetical protein
MQNIPSQVGIEWIRQGFALFRKQPAELSMLFLLYMLLMFAVSLIPLIGQALPLLLVPVFSMAFLQACVHIEQGKKVLPNLLWTGFRSPALPILLQLGVIYMLAAVFSVAASSVVDGGVFWKLLSGQLNPEKEKIVADALPLAMIFAALIYIPFCMALWHAAPLAAWQRMNLVKSIFYSFFAVRNCGKAFLAYGLGWIVMGIAIPAFISAILMLAIGRSEIMMMVLMPFSIVMTIVMYCSFYPTYVQVFDRPGAAKITEAS